MRPGRFHILLPYTNTKCAEDISRAGYGPFSLGEKASSARVPGISVLCTGQVMMAGLAVARYFNVGRGNVGTLPGEPSPFD